MVSQVPACAHLSIRNLALSWQRMELGLLQRVNISSERFTASSPSITYTSEGLFVLQADRFCLAPLDFENIGGMVTRWWDGLVVSRLEDLLSFEECKFCSRLVCINFYGDSGFIFWKWPALDIGIKAFNRFGASGQSPRTWFLSFVPVLGWEGIPL